MLVNQIEKFFVHCGSLLFIPVPNRLGCAMMQVIPEQRLPYPAQRFLHGGDLNHNVGAVAVFFDHLLKPSNLPFDSSQALQIGDFDLCIDTCRFTTRFGMVHQISAYTPYPYLSTGALNPAVSAKFCSAIAFIQTFSSA
jgi:hypothetical protein